MIIMKSEISDSSCVEFEVVNGVFELVCCKSTHKEATLLGGPPTGSIHPCFSSILHFLSSYMCRIQFGNK